jgi:hypothetical protein
MSEAGGSFHQPFFVTTERFEISRELQTPQKQKTLKTKYVKFRRTDVPISCVHHTTYDYLRINVRMLLTFINELIAEKKSLQIYKPWYVTRG